MPVTMSRLNLIKGLGPVLQIAEGWTVEIDPEIHKLLDERTDRTWPTTWFVPRLCDKPAFKDVYSVMNNLGSQSRCHQLRTYRSGFDYARFYPSHTGMYAQCGR